MSEKEKLIFSVINFLNNEIRSGNISPDASESIEVAIQCLETAYNIDIKNSETIQRLSQDGSLLEIFKQHNAAPSDLASAIKVSEEDKAAAEVLKNEGNELMKNEKYLNALRCYTDAIKLYPSNPVYYCNRAAAHSKMNDHEMAVSDCKHALSLDVGYGKAHGRMGLALASLNKHKDAVDSYNKALEMEPDNASYKNNLNFSLEKLQEASTSNPSSNVGGVPPNPFGTMGGYDLGGLLNNPQLMNMATQMMANPQMQQFMSNMVGGMAGQGGPSDGAGGMGMDAFLQAGQQLASQLQQENPELIEQLRSQQQGQGNNDDNDTENPNGHGDNKNEKDKSS